MIKLKFEVSTKSIKYKIEINYNRIVYIKKLRLNFLLDIYYLIV